MRSSDLIATRKVASDLGWNRGSNQDLLSKTVRIGFLAAILGALLFLQSAQGQFINIDMILPLYGLMTLSFLANGLYVIFYDKASTHPIFNWLLFTYDAVVVTGLIFYTGTNQSLFLFLYLVNIILCAMVFQRSGAYLLAAWTSILFSSLLVFGPDLSGQSRLFALALNNLAFFSVAYLGGILSEQIKLLGTEVKVQGQSIEALKDLNRLIVDNVATGLITTDLQGEVTHTNKAALKIFDRVGVTGRSLTEVLPQMEGMFQAGEFLKTQDEPHRYEVELASDGGERQVVETIISPLKSGSGNAKGYVLLVQDLTRVKNLEFAMRQQEKLAAVGQLAAGIAHEIRNPLASISGSIQLLSAGFEADNLEEAKLSRIILREIDRLNNLISEFLEFVRPEAQVEDPVNINGLLGEILDMAKVHDKLRKDVVQEVQFEAGQLVSGNYDKLKQAFLNIVINAYQAMEGVEDAVISVKSYDDQDRVVVIVKDTGKGMDEANLKRIFEPFHTTKSSGTGLGLAVTHKIFEVHKAKVYVNSDIGQGTTFTIEFPGKGDTDEGKMFLRKQA